MKPNMVLMMIVMVGKAQQHLENISRMFEKEVCSTLILMSVIMNRHPLHSHF
jgi:hypothetical protein